jgi:chemotaxis protein MotB
VARRRKKEEEHENHERWMVSYADFITLLFAFFVVMYSLSSLNEGKYRVMSDSVVQAFRSIGTHDAGRQVVAIAPIPSIRPAPAQRGGRGAAPGQGRARAQHGRGDPQGARSAGGRWPGAGHRGRLRHHRRDQCGGALAPGEAQLGPDAVRALRAVAQVVADAEFPITVEGHTDVMPIASAMFPSNWELSAVRASSVVRLFVEGGVRPSRLTAAGYGDQRPVADNATAEGRARNRRVTILVESRLVEPAVTAPVKASGVADSILPADAAPPPAGDRRRSEALTPTAGPT